MSVDSGISRRNFLKSLAAGTALGIWPGLLQAAKLPAIRKAIPATGEQLPVIGMGSSRTFDVGNEPEERQELQKVLQAFFDHGGALVDSSPMYGNAESVLGDLLGNIKNKKNLFAATKVWTDGKQQGIEQMKRSMARMGVKKFDLMQIHNLRDWAVHLDTLKQWKADGKIRYIGVTTSHGRFHEELQSLLEIEDFDFVQFSYNIGNRDVEKHLLPVAAERGIAVLVNRPYMRGELFRQVKGKSLPEWVKDFDCQSWGQFFLKYAVSHPAVTCAIPATSKVRHMIDNMGAGFGRLPDMKERQRMYKYFQSL